MFRLVVLPCFDFRRSNNSSQGMSVCVCIHYHHFLPHHMIQEAGSGDDQGEDEEEERGGDGSGGGLMSVFSRVDHLTALGLHGAPSSARTTTQTDTAENEGEEEGERTKEGRVLGFEGRPRLHCGDCSADVPSTAREDSPATSRTTQLKRSGPHGHEAKSGDMDWGQFKSTFMEQLIEGAGEKTDISTATAAMAIKEHLLIESIAALQAQREQTAGNTRQTSQTGLTSQTSQADLTSQTCQTDTADTQCSHTPGGHDQASHTQEAAILPMSLLAGIDLTQLDKALEEMEVGGASGRGQTQEGQRSDLPPPLKLAWGGSGGGLGGCGGGSGGSGGGSGGSGGGSGGSDLMNQLVAMNQASLQTLPTNRIGGGVEGRREGRGEEGRVGKVSSSPLGEVPEKGGERETMYIDLRLANQHWNGGRKLTELEKERL